MAQALVSFFDDAAESGIQALWRRLDDAGVPSIATRSGGKHRPHVTFAAAAGIPTAARKALRTELELLSIPDLWLHTLGTFPGEDRVLLLGAVVDTELLAVHSAVHDALAGRVQHPSAYYFPGAWIPHCTLAQGITDDQLAVGFRALQPPEPVRAGISEIAIVDTRTGDTETIITR
ncbi:2'-5' RNA ligase family protein [Saccharopolyspora sp. ASAGF58]|uniref:2'-5' RNA ligase family protein n=1 Tax=Saccharopolyspora sp. ASAGF58 TaxID=2719023 RepID=UPI001440035E|nr:2'-5' RNA ligase family protein [Saccharopolyspora sp. ASAGF58]QIZ35589.1 2'-5' RNA ligase family protein [Saccharopolyspora sp. ASAGF58]